MTTTDPASIHEPRSARSRRIAEAHFAAEVANDTDVVMRSMVSGDFMATAVVEGGPGGRILVSCSTEAGQREHYDRVRTRILVRGADIFTSIGGDFYGFIHGIVHVELVSDGTRSMSEAIGVMPVDRDEDAICGEIGLGIPADARAGDAPGSAPLQRVANLRVHERWLAAMRSGDVDRLMGCYSIDALGAARQPGPRRLEPLRGRDAVREFYDRLFSTFDVESIDVVIRVVDRAYVFNELAWVLRSADGRLHHHRSANAIVVGADDAIMLDVGYGSDLTPVETPGEVPVGVGVGA